MKLSSHSFYEFIVTEPSFSTPPSMVKTTTKKIHQWKHCKNQNHVVPGMFVVKTFDDNIPESRFPSETPSGMVIAAMNYPGDNIIDFSEDNHNYLILWFK